MQGNNLNVTISADATKFEQEMGRAQAALRALQRESKRANDELIKTGDSTKADAVAPKLAAARAEVRALTASTAQLGVATQKTSTDIATLGLQLGKFAKASGIAIGGIKALRFGLAGFAGAQVIRGLNDAIDKITELQDASKKIGLDPAVIKQFGDAIAQTGGKAEDARPMLEKLVEPFSKEKKAEMVSWWGEANDAARNGLPMASDYARALADLGINMQRFKNDAAGMRDLTLAVAQALLRLRDAGKIDQANQLSMELFGKNIREAGEGLERFIQLNAQPATPSNLTSPEAAANVKTFNENVNALSLSWNELVATFTKSFVFEGINTLLKDANETLQTTTREVEALLDLLKRALQFIGAIDQTDFGGGGDNPPVPIPGRAAGGMIRGPGSGTSDSVLARVSNGEYVMRTRAVNHWGPRFMAAINAMRNPFSFAQGGLVGRAFADGGLVTATTDSGATINLHFPGGSFSLRGDNAIVAGLTREARRASMLAAGRA